MYIYNIITCLCIHTHTYMSMCTRVCMHACMHACLSMYKETILHVCLCMLLLVSSSANKLMSMLVPPKQSHFNVTLLACNGDASFNASQRRLQQTNMRHGKAPARCFSQQAPFPPGLAADSNLLSSIIRDPRKTVLETCLVNFCLCRIRLSSSCFVEFSQRATMQFEPLRL